MTEVNCIAGRVNGTETGLITDRIASKSRSLDWEQQQQRQQQQQQQQQQLQQQPQRQLSPELDLNERNPRQLESIDATWR